MRNFVCKFTAVAMLLALPVPAVNVVVAQGPPDGTGIVLDNVTGVSLPILGDDVAQILVDQAVITDLKVIEDLVGAIIGLEATGTLTGTLTATGVEIVDEQFTSTLAITSSGPGQCELVQLQLGPLELDALGLVALDVPVAEVTVSGSGAVGSLLCTLGNLLSGVIGGATRGVQGVVNAINRII